MDYSWVEDELKPCSDELFNFLWAISLIKWKTGRLEDLKTVEEVVQRFSQRG